MRIYQKALITGAFLFAVAGAPSLARAQNASQFGSKSMIESISIATTKADTARSQKKETTGFYSGNVRMSIENAGMAIPERLKWGKMYSDLMDTTFNILGGMGIGPGKEEQFITEIAGIMYGNMSMKYGGDRVGFLWKSLENNYWDCKNSVCFVADVARRLGIKVEFVIVPQHIFLKVGQFCFETTLKDRYFRYSDIGKFYRGVYLVSGDLRVTEYMAYHVLGRNAKYSPKAADAATYFKKAISLAPETPDPYIQLGIIYTQLGRHDDAMAQFWKAKSIDASLPYLYNAMGYTYYKQGNIEQAIGCFKKALGVKSLGYDATRDHIDASINLMNIYEMNGDIQTAHRYWLIYDKLDPDPFIREADPAAKTKSTLK